MSSAMFSLFAAACKGSSFFGFPTWYEYLPGATDKQGHCAPTISGINDVWLIVAAVITILLRIAAMVAVAMIVYGAISYVTSQGEPDKTGQAKGTIVNALVGLALAVMAGVIVSFIAGGF